MDKYFQKVKDENYKKYILPLEQADEAMKIAEAIFRSDCVLRKEMYYGVQEYQKEFLLNLATDKDFLALKPRQCGVTDLLAAHIAAKIIRHDCGITYSNDKLNILMVFANAQLVDEFVKKLKQCLSVANYTSKVKRFDHRCYLDKAQHTCVKFCSANSLLSIDIKDYSVDEMYFDEYAFMKKEIIEELCLVNSKAKKVFITTPQAITTCFTVMDYLSNDHNYQDIKWFETLKYRGGGLFAYKSERIDNLKKDEIEQLVKDGWKITSPTYAKYKEMLGESFINELNDYTYGRKEKN